MGWLVLRLTDSPASLGLTSFASWSPTLFLSLYAGVLADRIDRRVLLMTTQIVIVALAALLALLVTVGQIQFWHVVAIALLTGSAQALSMPAFQALVPTLVDREAMGNAIALNSAQFNLSRIVGPALAGMQVATGGVAPNIWVHAPAGAVLG